MEEVLNKDDAYVNIKIHRSQLEIISNWIGCMNVSDSVSNIAEEDKSIVLNSVQDFYQLMCDKLEGKEVKPSTSTTQGVLTNAEEDLLKECFLIFD